MSDVPIGKLVDETAQRDAIHIAIAPVIAAEKLSPGQHIGFVGDSTERVAYHEVHNKGKYIGIVDPFLTTLVFPDDRFLMFLYPNTVTGMRHHWSHPAFSEQPAIATSDDLEWLDSIAHQCGKTRSALIDDAKCFAQCEDYIYDNSERYKDVSSADWCKFWAWLETNHGVKPPQYADSSPYTCSC